MRNLKKYIFKKQFFTLKYINILTNYPIFLFLKYDSSSSNFLNLLRINCINNDLSVFLLNSKYINNFIFNGYNINNVSWLKNDIILIPFINIDKLLFFFSFEKLYQSLNHFKPIGLSFHNYLLNLIIDYKDLINYKNANNYLHFYNLLNLYNLLLINTFTLLLNYLIYFFDHLIIILNNNLLNKK